MNYFIYTSHHFTPHGKYEGSKLTSLPMCGFKAQLIEHRTGIAEGHRFKSCWSPDFFQASSFQVLELEIYCDGHSSLSSTPAVQYELFHIYFTSFLHSVTCGYVVIMSVHKGVTTSPAHQKAKLLFILTILVHAICRYMYIKWTHAYFIQHLTRQ